MRKCVPASIRVARITFGARNVVEEDLETVANLVRVELKSGENCVAGQMVFVMGRKEGPEQPSRTCPVISAYVTRCEWKGREWLAKKR